MKLTIFCKTCSKDVGSADLQSANLVDTILMMVHCAMPHSGHHALEAKVDGVEIGSAGPVDVTVKCLFQHCAGKPPSVFKVPREWVTAALLLHHTQHEGHPMELTVDGVPYKLPY